MLIKTVELRYAVDKYNIIRKEHLCLTHPLPQTKKSLKLINIYGRKKKLAMFNKTLKTLQLI